MNIEAKKLLLSNRVAFLIAGFALAAWAPMIPFIKDRFALDEHNLGLLLLCVGIGSLIAMPTSGFFSAKFGCKTPIYVATFGVAICLLLVPLINNIYLMGLTLIFFGMFAIVLDVVANINAAMLEKVTKMTVMSGLHGLYSVGGFFGSISVTFLLGAQFSLFDAAIYSFVVLLIGLFIGCRNLFTSDEENKTLKNEKLKQHNPLFYYTNPTVLLIGLMCFIMFLTEGSMLDWSGVFLHSERGLALEHAGYGYAAFAIMMTIFRLIGDKVVQVFGKRKIILLGTLCISSGYMVAVFIPHYIASFAGFALIGIGASNVVPQLVSFVAKVKEVPMHISVTLVNAIGFTGILCGPALIGFLSHAITLSNTYICQGLSVLLVTILSLIILQKEKSTKEPISFTDNCCTDKS